MIDGELWDRPDDDSPQARERSRLYNASTLLTLMAGVVICYAALYVVNLAWAFFILNPDVMGSSVHAPLGYGDLFVLAWFVASAATVGGGLGSGLETDEAIRAATYSKREQDRRDRLAARPEPRAIRRVTAVRSLSPRIRFHGVSASSPWPRSTTWRGWLTRGAPSTNESGAPHLAPTSDLRRRGTPTGTQ